MIAAAGFSLLIAAGQPVFIWSIIGLVFAIWIHLGVIYLLGLFWRRTTKIGVICGLVVGLVLTIVWNFILPRPFGIAVPGPLEALFTAAVIVVVSLLTYGRVAENIERREKIRDIGELHGGATHTAAVEEEAV